MINRYKRTARNFEELGLGELVPLNQAIPELAWETSTEQEVGLEVGHKVGQEQTEKSVSAVGHEGFDRSWKGPACWSFPATATERRRRAVNLRPMD